MTTATPTRLPRSFDVTTTVYLVLASATLFSWFLGTEEAAAHEPLIGSIVIAIAFIKLRLVGIHFMELGRAPIVLRGIFEGYVFVTFLTILVLFLVV